MLFHKLHIVSQWEHPFLWADSSIDIWKCLKLGLNPRVLVAFGGKALASACNNPSDAFFVSVNMRDAFGYGLEQVGDLTFKFLDPGQQSLIYSVRVIGSGRGGGLDTADLMQNDTHLVIREPGECRQYDQGYRPSGDGHAAT